MTQVHLINNNTCHTQFKSIPAFRNCPVVIFERCCMDFHRFVLNLITPTRGCTQLWKATSQL